MLWLWFTCFLVTLFYILYLLPKFKKLPELEAQVKQKLTSAIEKEGQAILQLQKAESIYKDANRLKTEAEKRVDTVLTENKVFHSAIEEIVNLWINDSWKSIVDRLTPTNYATQKSRMEKVFETCRKYGIEFDGRQERAFYRKSPFAMLKRPLVH